MFGFNKITDTYHNRVNQMFGSFTNAFGNGTTLNGVPVDGLEAWWNPEYGVVTSGGRVVTWTDMSGNYTLRPTVITNVSTIVGPAYVTGANSTFNGKPYINFDPIPGQPRNLAPSAPFDENFLNKTFDGGYTVLWVVYYVDALNQLSPAMSSNGMGTVPVGTDLRAYGNGSGLVSVTTPTTGIINLQSISTDLKTGRWWYSFNGNYASLNRTDAAVTRNVAAPYNIYNNAPSGIFFISNSISGGRVYVFDRFVYNKILNETEYKLVWEHIKSKYRA